MRYFGNHIKYTNGIKKNYQSAICKMKTCKCVLITAVAYDEDHKTVAQFKSQ
jgi:hypothetical protein